MSRRLPIVSAKTFEKLLFALGFENIRRKGSHAFYRRKDGVTTTLPHHPGRDLSRPLIREILREIDLDPAEFARLLKRI